MDTIDRTLEFTNIDMGEILENAEKYFIPAGELIFSEGDKADYIYFIYSGKVSVYIEQFTKTVELCELESGQLFGEIGIINESNRSASVMAIEDCELLGIDTETFKRYSQQDPDFSFKIKQQLNARLENLTHQENLLKQSVGESVDTTLSIKGDPSLRESIFTRTRYVSVVDKILPQLIPSLKNLLLNHSAHQIYIHFNSGEISVTTIFDPFNAEIHTAKKLIDQSYINRHFPKISYAEKLKMINRLNASIDMDQASLDLPEIFKKSRDTFQPVTPEQINTVISRLSDLRNIPDLYLRNFSFNITRDAIRMQFNCDGTHIVTSEEYIKFIELNLMPEE